MIYPYLSDGGHSCMRQIERGVTSRHHVSTISGPQQPFLTQTAICIVTYITLFQNSKNCYKQVQLWRKRKPRGQPYIKDLLVERWKKSMDYCFVPEYYYVPESHRVMSIFFFFVFLFCHLQDHGLLRSRNFATIATWRNDFPSRWQPRN